MNLAVASPTARVPLASSAPVRLLVCGAGAQDGADADWLATLSACGWRHERIEAAYARLPADPDAAFHAVTARLEATGASGVLLVAASPSPAAGFVVEMRARNRRARSLAGASGSRRIAETGPACARATAPVADLARALAAAGLPAATSSDGAEDALNHLLYRLLTEVADAVDGPAVGALRAPASAAQGTQAEGAQAEGAQAELVQRGLRAALLAFADTLGPTARVSPADA